MYLKRIVALTEARQVCDDTYFLKAGGKRFLLNDRAVRIISHGGGKSTCLFIPAHPNMPRQEVIASALQQLKNNSCKSAAPSESATSSRLVFLVERNVGGILPSPFSLLGPPSKRRFDVVTALPPREMNTATTSFAFKPTQESICL